MLLKLRIGQHLLLRFSSCRYHRITQHFPLHPLASSYSSSTPSQQHHLPPTLSQHSTTLMSNRTHDMLCVSSFSERWWCEKELAKENRRQDAQRLSNTTKAKHEIVYACLEDNKLPTAKILIDIFMALLSFHSKDLSVADLTVLAVLFVCLFNFIAALLVDVMW